MKNLLIIYPHWPPSNLAGVHRARLISNYLSEFGWQAHVLTVSEEFYEEAHDAEIVKTVNPKTQVYKVAAKSIRNTNRYVGDIGLRAFRNLEQKAIEIINEKSIDFLWAPIPSFYNAVIARRVHNSTGIPYGIDYIDPWVDSFVGQEKIFSKAWLSNRLAHVLEPYSVKKASLISGVSEAYYQSVLKRNFSDAKIKHIGMPYGFDPHDHDIKIKDVSIPWHRNIEAYVYAGAFLPASHTFLDVLFDYIQKEKVEGNWPVNRRLYFIGTGRYPGKQILEYAKEHDIQEIVFELHDRRPFLEVLNLLSQSSGVMVIGSTEKHYTASKIFQSLLSKQPVFSIFHAESSVVKILSDCQAKDYLVQYEENIGEHFRADLFQKASSFFQKEKEWNPNLSALDKYSAKESARLLVEKLNEIVE